MPSAARTSSPSTPTRQATSGLAFGLTAALDAELKPIAEMESLIYERTGAQPGTIGGWFKLNPKVDDIPESFSITHRGVRLLRLGTVRGGGAGCLCPENALLKALVTHLLLRKNQSLILDMEAGVEHLGRGTASSVDAFVIVVEPGLRSLGTAEQIRGLAGGDRDQTDLPGGEQGPQPGGRGVRAEPCRRPAGPGQPALHRGGCGRGPGRRGGL